MLFLKWLLALNRQILVFNIPVPGLVSNVAVFENEL
jgi:hypothetical protein